MRVCVCVFVFMGCMCARVHACVCMLSVHVYVYMWCTKFSICMYILCVCMYSVGVCAEVRGTTIFDVHVVPLILLEKILKRTDPKRQSTFATQAQQPETEQQTIESNE